MDETTTNPLDTMKKVDNLWFDDADVIFYAGKSKFRVYRGILSAQSTIFRDMFALPLENDDAHARNESFTTIALPDDETDVYYFFLAIFDSSFYEPPPSSYPRFVTISILRLAHKYDVAFLLRRAVKHLNISFPLQRNNNIGVVWAVGAPPDPNPSATYALAKKEELDLLQIAENLDLPWITPIVLYHIVEDRKFDIAAIWEHPSFRRLSPKSQFLVAQCSTNRAMLREGRDSWVGMLPSVNCQSYEACGRLSRAIQTGINTQTPPYSGFLPFNWAPAGVPSFCGNCQDAGRQRQQEIEDRFWKNYAVTCGFDGWEELRRLRKEAMTALDSGVKPFDSIKFGEENSS